MLAWINLREAQTTPRQEATATLIIGVLLGGPHCKIDQFVPRRLPCLTFRIRCRDVPFARLLVRTSTLGVNTFHSRCVQHESTLKYKGISQATAAQQSTDTACFSSCPTVHPLASDADAEAALFAEHLVFCWRLQPDRLELCLNKVTDNCRRIPLQRLHIPGCTSSDKRW